MKNDENRESIGRREGGESKIRSRAGLGRGRYLESRE
jgi:hypothetical protein